MKLVSSDQLKSVALKITKPRIALLEILSESSKPLDVEAIQPLLRQKKIAADQATIYRILKTFFEKQIVHKVFIQEGKIHYELTDRPHHHHVVCTICGSIQDIEECGISTLEREIEKKTGFTVASHSFELFGTCSSCKHEKILRSSNRKSTR